MWGWAEELRVSTEGADEALSVAPSTKGWNLSELLTMGRRRR